MVGVNMEGVVVMVGVNREVVMMVDVATGIVVFM